ncbi:MAG: leucine-rich repeat domain-containing protein [Clostridia bacterium]
MKTKALILFLVLALAAGGCSAAWGYSFLPNEGTITGYRAPGLKRSITIPETIGNIEVVRIGEASFANNELLSITIPGGVASIGDWAFHNNDLAEVIIPSGVTSIGAYAFSGNPLKSITMLGDDTEIGEGMVGGLGFRDAYLEGGAGTYVRSRDGHWKRDAAGP